MAEQNDGVPVVERGTNRKVTSIKYIYATIPAEYVCVYHRILAMLSDYGEEMLKDCKATCKDRNSGIIECFNMFNAAVAAKQLGQESRANAYIKFIKAKINQIYKGKDNSTSFVFPVDETGELKAFVSCGDTPMFAINPEDGNLFEHKFHKGFDEHFALGKEDGVYHDEYAQQGDFVVTLDAHYEQSSGVQVPCAEINAYLNGEAIDLTRATVSYYFDDRPVVRFNDVTNISNGMHKFTVVVKYKGCIDVQETYEELK